MILHQQLNGFDFSAYVSKRNSDMNSKIAFVSCQTYALHLSPGGKERSQTPEMPSCGMCCSIRF